MFGKAAELERSTASEHEYMIVEYAPVDHFAIAPNLIIFDSHVCLVNKFISVPRELRGLNCAAFVAGIVAGILDAAEFVRTVHSKQN